VSLASIEKMSLVVKLSPSQWTKTNLPSASWVGSVPETCFQVVTPWQAVALSHLSVEQRDSAYKVKAVPRVVGAVQRAPTAVPAALAVLALHTFEFAELYVQDSATSPPHGTKVPPLAWNETAVAVHA